MKKEIVELLQVICLGVGLLLTGVIIYMIYPWIKQAMPGHELERQVFIPGITSRNMGLTFLAARVIGKLAMLDVEGHQ